MFQDLDTKFISLILIAKSVQNQFKIRPTIFLVSPKSDRLRPNINFCDRPAQTQEQMFNLALANRLRSLPEKISELLLGSKSKAWLNKLDAVVFL
jgi:hypothetical protein